jgi:hypothetical protein
MDYKCLIINTVSPSVNREMEGVLLGNPFVGFRRIPCSKFDLTFRRILDLHIRMLHLHRPSLKSSFVLPSNESMI